MSQSGHSETLTSRLQVSGCDYSSARDCLLCPWCLILRFWLLEDWNKIFMWHRLRGHISTLMAACCFPSVLKKKKKKSHCQLEYIHTSRLLPQQPMQIVTACLKKSWLTWSHTNNLESHSYTLGISLIIISWNHSWTLTTHTGVINTSLHCNNKQSITEILH